MYLHKIKQSVRGQGSRSQIESLKSPRLANFNLLGPDFDMFTQNISHWDQNGHDESDSRELLQLCLEVYLVISNRGVYL